MRILINAILIIIGIIIAPLSFLKWSGTGFLIEPLYSPGDGEGRTYLFIFLLGISMVLYGFFNLLIFHSRAMTKEDDDNQTP